MKAILESIERRILSEDRKRSRSRSAVIEAFFRGRTHVTVYRTLKLLSRMGYAKELDFGDGARRYESNLSAQHDHLVCTGCGKVIEFEDPDVEKLQDLVTRRHGFLPEAHRLEIFGRCRKCASSAGGQGGR